MDRENTRNWAKLFGDALASGRPEEAMDILKRNKWLATVLSLGDGGSALHSAAEANRVELIDLLLEFGADIDAKDMDGNSPLGTAISNLADAAASVLVQRGACLEELGPRFVGSTPLIKASELGLINTVRKLVARGVNIHARSTDDWNETALEAADAHGYWEICALIEDATIDQDVADRDKSDLTS